MSRNTVTPHNSQPIKASIHRANCGRQTNKSWLDYYYRISGSTRTRCAAQGCSNPVEVGAHVRITDQRRSHRNAWYIAPLCRACNHPSMAEELELERNTLLVEAMIR